MKNEKENIKTKKGQKTFYFTIEIKELTMNTDYDKRIQARQQRIAYKRTFKD